MDDTHGRSGVEARTGLQVSVEAALYAGLVVLATVLRLVRLDWLPLDGHETAVAMPAWTAALGDQATSVPPQPLLFHLERSVFWLLGGGSDVTARLVPAVAGVALVALAWRLRPVLGRPAALALAGLLSASPLWVFFGREVSSVTLSSAAVLLLLGSLAGTGRYDRHLVPFAAGLVLVSTGVSFTFVVAGLVYLAVATVRGELRDHLTILDGLWPEPEDRRRAVIVFGVTVVLAATGAISRPDGFAALLQAPVDWLAATVASQASWQGAIGLPLLAYGPVTVVFGLAGLAWMVRRGGRLGLFVALWCLAALIVTLLARTTDVVPDLVLPLTIAASAGLAGLAALVAEGFRWQEEGVMCAILVVVLGFGLIEAAAHSNDASPASARLAAGSILLFAALVAVYAVLWGGRLALRVLGLTALVGLSVLAWSNGTALSYRGGRIVREPLHNEYATADAAALASHLAQSSWAETRDPNTLQTMVDPKLSAFLRWPLRERLNLTWAEPGTETDTRAVIVPSADEKPELGAGSFRGMPFAIEGRWRPQLNSLQDFLRWYLQRRAPAGSSMAGDIAYQQVDLYLRTDS